jgi:hypothetical protein
MMNAPRLWKFGKRILPALARAQQYLLRQKRLTFSIFKTSTFPASLLLLLLSVLLVYIKLLYIAAYIYRMGDKTDIS